MAERPADGALVGPTFRCLLAKQLSDTRRSDRFFYDLPQQPGSFSPGNKKLNKRLRHSSCGGGPKYICSDLQ
jgi:Animal haem peroxidase